MSSSIIKTKLYVPRRPLKEVARQRLFDRINQSIHRKLTLISAPAGFGKTTLASQWVLATAHKTCWLSLEAEDRELGRFLSYFVKAVQQVSDVFGNELLAVLASPQLPPFESIMSRLLNEMHVVQEQCVVVFDDFHLVDDQKVARALGFLLEHLPDHYHFIITTRKDPPLPLAKLRAQGQILELREHDLRFNTLEMTAFYKDVMKLVLSKKELGQLESRTEGWVAGMQLAGISLQGCHDKQGFISTFSGDHHYIVDYLLEEVLHKQTEEVQDFLLFTSVLDRMCGALCAAILDVSVEVAHNRLALLHKANLFVIPLDDQREWYRYHHLFADALQARLKKQYVEMINVLHNRASEWYEDNGLTHQAVQHAFAVHDYHRAADLAELAWKAMDRALQSYVWLEWVKAIPEDILYQRPVLRMGYAWALLDMGELEAANAQLYALEKLIDINADPVESLVSLRPTVTVVDEDQYRTLPATIAFARAFYAQALSETGDAAHYAKLALGLVHEEDQHQRSTIEAVLSVAYWTKGDLEAAEDVVTRSIKGLRAAGNDLFAVCGMSVLAEIRVAQGRLQSALVVYEQAIQFAEERGDAVVRGLAGLYLGLCDLYHQQGNVSEAQRCLERSEQLGFCAALPIWEYRVCITKSRIKQSRGDFHQALDLLLEAEKRYCRSPLPVVQPIAAIKARLWIIQGNLVEAQRWVKSQNLSVHETPNYLGEYEYITWARWLLAAYKKRGETAQLEEALQLLKNLLEAAETAGWKGSVIEILILLALAYQMQNELTRATQAVEHALSLAEPERYVRLFIDEGGSIEAILSLVQCDSDVYLYAQQLLQVFRLDRLANKGSDKQGLIEPLSQRELNVLELIAQGYSNREISEQLFIALDTVKGHNRRIFAKLGVRRRTEAVAKARSLDLIPITK